MLNFPEYNVAFFLYFVVCYGINENFFLKEMIIFMQISAKVCTTHSYRKSRISLSTPYLWLMFSGRSALYDMENLSQSLLIAVAKAQSPRSVPDQESNPEPKLAA